MSAETWASRAATALLGAVAPVSMLAVDPAGWFPFGPVKWLAVSTLVLAGAAALWSVTPLRVPRSLGLALLVLLAAMAAAAAVGEDPLYAWIGTPERRFGVVGWALCVLAMAAGCSLGGNCQEKSSAGDGDAGQFARRRGRDGTPAPQHAVAAGLAVAALGVGGVATVEALGWEPPVLDAGGRLTGTFGSAAYLGAAAALLLPVVIGVATDRSQPLAWRRAAALAGPLLAVTVLGSGARAAWVGLVTAALWSAWARRGALLGSPRRSVGLAVAGAVASVLLVVATPLGSRLVAITDPDAPGGQGRVDEWRVATAVLAEHPLTGVGPEGYRVAFADGVDAAYERDHGREVQPDRAHSGPLDVALAGGLPGLAAWLAAVLIVGGAVRRALRWGSGWVVGAAAALVAHLAGQLFLFPVVELEPVAWLLGGLLVAAAPSRPRRDLAAAPGGVRTTAVVVPLLVVGLLGVLALVGLVGGAAEIVADRRAGDASDALATGSYRHAADRARSALDLRPDVLRLHLLAARAAVAAEEGLHVGIRHLDDALDLSPGDPIALRQRVELLVARAAATQVPVHVDAARDELRRLLVDDPNNRLLWRQAAVLADVTGDGAAFKDAQSHLAELAPDDEPTP